jgi:hypothetical protein
MKQKTLLFLTVLMATSSSFAFTSIASKYYGLQMANENGLARIANWSPDNNVEFSGEGQVKMKDHCLHGPRLGLVTWRPCQAELPGAQTWSFKDGLLKNSKGYCAEVETTTNPLTHPRVYTKKCKAGVNAQLWDVK